MPELSYDYIRGLIDGEGCFSFCSIPANGKKVLLPAFMLRMAIRDKELIERVRDKLCLKNKVYCYSYQGKDGFKRQPQAVLIVRDLGALRRTIIPLFYKKLIGHKGKQFEAWIERIGNDPLVPESYKIIYRLHKTGFYNSDNRFL